MSRRSIVPFLLTLAVAGCGMRQTTYQPLTDRGRQCMQTCRDRYEGCQVECFASTGCLERCVTDQNTCFAACPDVQPVAD